MEDSFVLNPETAQRAIAHMNEDHADACLRYAHYYGKREDAVSALMKALDTEGFSLEILTTEGPEDLRIPFKKPLSSEKDSHTFLVAMAIEAKKGLAKATD